MQAVEDDNENGILLSDNVIAHFYTRQKCQGFIKYIKHFSSRYNQHSVRFGGCFLLIQKKWSFYYLN